MFRTEKMNEPYLLSQYNPIKDETSYIFGMIYDQKEIPTSENHDTDVNVNYYTKYQSNEKTDTPSLFIFLIEQSGSMSGSSKKLVRESLLFFLQSLPKDSYFQLIGFGSKFVKINSQPVLYNKENVKYSMNKIKNLEANLGGTDISTPLKYIFNNNLYDDINLGRNLYILTDGEVNNREECLELISSNSEKFKVHAIGIGSSFDKILIQNAGLQGKGSYQFVNNISDINSVIIQSLSKCLRNYLLNVKINLDKIKPEYDFRPKINFIYPDEFINYYFILKGKGTNENIQINFESSNKKENYIFSKDKIIKENDGEIIGQIIIGNILKNNKNELDENIEIKLSKDYQILSNKTTLFTIVEGEDSNKIAEFKKVSLKEKYHNRNKEYVTYGTRGRRRGFRGRGGGFRGRSGGFRGRRGAFIEIRNNNINYLFNDNNFYGGNRGDNGIDSMKEFGMNRQRELNYNNEGRKFYENINLYKMKNGLFKNNNNKTKKIEKSEFSPKELVLTQDIFDGNWSMNELTKYLTKKEKNIYEQIEKIMKEKNLDKEEIKITVLVLYYLSKNSSINKIEYSLIIKKGINFLEKNGINFEQICSGINS